MIKLIELGVDNKDWAYVACCDLRKTFDSIDQNILLEKLEYYDTRGLPLQIFGSYLENLQQFVVFNGELSTTRNLSCGVPHGSVLGLILFLICINDLRVCTGVHKFAVDATCINTG